MRILIIGGSGGIGQAMLKYCLEQWPTAMVHASYYRNKPTLQHKQLSWHSLNIHQEDDIRNLAAQFKQVDWLINTVGLLHTKENGPEKTLKQLSPDFFLSNIKTNTLASLLLAKHFQASLKASPHSHFAVISARVGSIEDNQLGGWMSYRSSKAALNMALKTISIEWQRTLPNCCVSSLHPGTTDTALSKPFQKNVPAGKLFSGDKTAALLVQLIQQLKPEDTGKFWSYNGSELPW